VKSTAVPAGVTLLEASAGTGKTFRIAHSVLRLVAEDGVRVERLVVVTFTEAATSELRERVRKRLRDGLLGLRRRAAGEVQSGPDEVLDAWAASAAEADVAAWAARLRTALVNFDDALICTIHGFCRRMLRRNAFESGAPFGSDVVAGLPDLLEDLAVDFWTRLVYGADPSLLRAIRAAGITVTKLKNLAEKASDEDLVLVPAPPPAGATTGPLPDPRPWLRARENLANAWDVNRVCRLFADPGVTVQRKRGGYESFPAGKTKNNAFDVRGRLRGNRAITPVDFLPSSFDYFAPARIACATLPGKTPPSSPAIASLAAFVAEHRRVRPLVADVLQGAKHALVAELRRELPRRARAANLRTYRDLLVDLRDGLRRGGGADSPLAAAIRRRYDVALIDEFQDTDPIQWEIFETLFSDRLRLIGDPKQAIYSFRGADVFTYAAAKGTAAAIQTLDRNFRSDASLLRAVGRLFARAQPFGEATTTYPPVQAEHPDTRLIGDDRAPLLFRFLPRAGAVLDRWGRYLLKGWLKERVARLVAEDLAGELARGTRIDGDDTPRTISARDCAVLVRSNAEAGLVQTALRELGIPSVIKSLEPVFKSPEATDLAAILQAVLEPTDTSTVRRALTTSLLGRTATDLLAMEADPDRFEAEVSPFHVWRGAWLEDGIAPMLRRMIDDDGMTPRLLAGPGGARAVTNLEHLAELLARAAREQSLGPAGLLSWLRRGGPGTDDEASPQRLESDDDAVQIVTMHSAKGLEWPLVWCPFLYYSSAWQSLDKDHLVFHDPDDGYRAKLDIGSPDREDHKKLRKQELFQEDLRLAYVALTRARHRCVVYWGACDRDAAVAYLLHRIALGKWRFNAATDAMKQDADMIRDLRALGPADEIDVEVVDWTAASPARRTSRAAVPTLEAGRLTRTRAPDDWWRRSSFTGLTRGGLDVRDHDDDGVDDEGDADDIPPNPDTPEPGGPSLASELVTLADFEAGRRAGNFLHEVLELHDFERPEALRPLAEHRLAAHGLDVGHAACATEGIQQALETPLTPAGDLRLADLPRRRRLDEMEFTLPSHGGFDATGEVLTAKALRKAFSDGGGPGLPAGWADRVGRLGFLPLRGFLTGAIDLVFEHGGRYYLADYKSNRLGRTYDDYARVRLPAAMSHAHYVLQYHLYSLALHRYLAGRLPGYAFDAHFGGVYYLFVRGMHPSLGASHGVFFDRPTERLIERLSRAVCGAGS